MASRQTLLFAAAVVVAVACLTAQAAATEWMVGDDGGWRAKFNETGWTDGKTFRVGDTLRFMYTRDQHTVVEVNGADFRACNLQGNRLGAWNSGDDVVPLDKPGRMWFISDKPNDCDQGMKMVITVLEAGAPAPAPEPPSESSAPVSFSIGAGAVAAAAGAVVVAAALAFVTPKESKVTYKPNLRPYQALDRPTLLKAQEPATASPHKTNSNPFENPFLQLGHFLLLPSRRRRNPNPSRRRLPRRRRPRRHHVEPQGFQDAPVRQLPYARDDPGRPAARGQVHGLRPPHEPRPRRLRGVPPPPSFQVLQDRLRRPRGTPHARPPPAPRRGGRLHDRRGPAAARRVPRQGRLGGRSARRPGSRARRRARGGCRPDVTGRSRPCWTSARSRRSGPWHDAAPDLAAADAQPLGGAGGVPAGRAPAAGRDSAHASWDAAAADADAVSTPAWAAPSWSVPWWTAAAVHEGTAADGAAQTRDARATSRDEAGDAAAVRTAQTNASPTAAAAWTEPAAVACLLSV